MSIRDLGRRLAVRVDGSLGSLPQVCCSRMQWIERQEIPNYIARSIKCIFCISS